MTCVTTRLEYVTRCEISTHLCSVASISCVSFLKDKYLLCCSFCGFLSSPETSCGVCRLNPDLSLTVKQHFITSQSSDLSPQQLVNDQQFLFHFKLVSVKLYKSSRTIISAAQWGTNSSTRPTQVRGFHWRAQMVTWRISVSCDWWHCYAWFVYKRSVTTFKEINNLVSLQRVTLFYLLMYNYHVSDQWISTSSCSFLSPQWPFNSRSTNLDTLIHILCNEVVSVGGGGCSLLNGCFFHLSSFVFLSAFDLLFPHQWLKKKLWRSHCKSRFHHELYNQ